MKKKKDNTVNFYELDTKGQLKAVIDYIKGWEKTHKKGDMNVIECVEILCDNDGMRYKKNGAYSHDLNDEYND